MKMDDDDGDDNGDGISDDNSDDNSECSRFGIDIGYTDYIMLMWWTLPRQLTNTARLAKLIGKRSI